MSSPPIDTPAMIAALEKTWLKTKTTKNAAAFIDALQADLNDANAEVLAITSDPDKRTNIELKVALDAAESERAAALATVAQLQEELRIERLTHNKMDAALREVSASVGSAIPPSDTLPPVPSDMPPITSQTAFNIASERINCAAIILNLSPNFMSDDVFEALVRSPTGLSDYGKHIRTFAARLILDQPAPVIASAA